MGLKPFTLLGLNPCSGTCPSPLGGPQGQLCGLSHALHTAILLGCHDLLEAHRLGLTGQRFLGRGNRSWQQQEGLGSDSREDWTGKGLGTV